jgi:predicted kinase
MYRPEVVILRGVPGVGKSTFAAKYPYYHVVSADNFFLQDGFYRFDPSKLGQAHQQCLRDYTGHVVSRHSVLVDNTNITATEIAPYVSLAEAFGLGVKIINLHSSLSPADLARRNVHGVPENVIANRIALMVEEEKRFLPWWKGYVENYLDGRGYNV